MKELSIISFLTLNGNCSKSCGLKFTASLGHEYLFLLMPLAQTWLAMQ
jgi:hypothetical protein